MPHITNQGRRLETKAASPCDNILSELNFISQELNTLSIQRARIVTALEGVNTQRRAAEIERDRQRTSPTIPGRPSSRRRRLSDWLSDAGDAAVAQDNQRRLAQAEARVQQAQRQIPALRAQLSQIDRKIIQKTQNDDRLRENWTRLGCIRTSGKRLPWRLHPPKTPSAGDFIV